MAITVKQAIEGTIIKELALEMSDVQDPIDYLNTIIQYTDQETIVRQTSVDTRTIARVDKYGKTADDSHIANYADRDYDSDTYTMPQSNILGFEIPYESLYRFGFDETIMERRADELELDDENARRFSEMIKTEIRTLIREIIENRRTEMEDALRNLGTASAIAAQKPLSLPMVGDAADREDHWNYDNKLGVELDEDGYAMGVDLFATGQKNIKNQRYGTSRPIIVLHASSYTKAESIHLPMLSLRQDYLTAGGSLEPLVTGGAKAVGVYNDPDHPKDWIMLGAKHTIHRKCMVSATGKQTNGITVRIYNNAEIGSIVIEVRDRSVVVIDSPIDILKSVVAA